jgi:hypothetical protein
MSNLERLLAKGAQIVGGDVILRHKTMGRFRNGDFLITPEGVDELRVIDVVVEEEVKPKAQARKRPPAQVPASPLMEDITVDVE